MGKSGKVQKRYFWQKQKEDQNTSQNQDLLDKPKIKVTDEEASGNAFTPPDGGWGWIVCLTSLWANGTVFGIINTFGIMYVQMREHYGKDDPEVSLKTAFVGSTCTGVTFLMCTVSSILSDRVGIRPTAVVGAVLATVGLVATAFIQKLELLYLTYGLILGIGSSMVYSPSLVILGHYFKKHMGLVNGIVSFGSSIFTIALTRILPYLLSSIDIKFVFLFLAGLHFMLIFFSLSWKPIFIKEKHLASFALSTESVYQHCGECCTWTKKFLNVKIWRNRAYVVWIVSLAVALFGYFVPFFHLPKYTEDNFPGEDGSWLILCLSITSGVSRIICGKVADIQWVSRIKMQQLAFLVLGVSTICIPFANSFGALIAISLIMGLCDGIFVCLLGPIAFDIVGPSEASQAIGFLLGIFSIPFTIGPPVAGWMYDTLGNYRVAFHVAGAPPILGAILMFLIPKVQQSFPAVTETMEFVSISMMDVYNDVKVPHRDVKVVKNGTPSGPATEIQLFTSQELVYHHPSKQREELAADGETSPILQEVENSAADDKVGTSPEQLGLQVPELVYRCRCKQGNEEPVEDKLECELHKKDDKTMVETNPDSVHDKDINENHPTTVAYEESNVQPEFEDNPIQLESTSLLNEIGKQLEAKVVYDSDERTSL